MYCIIYLMMTQKKSLIILEIIQKKKSKILIIEPLMPTNFFSLQFFLKVLDIGNFIRTKKQYLKLINKNVKISGCYVKKFGISSAIIFYGHLITK